MLLFNKLILYLTNPSTQNFHNFYDHKTDPFIVQNIEIGAQLHVFNYPD